MDFLELVTGARTCRRFREAEGMPAGMLDWLIECARVTPCGGNAQALRFAVAESPEACAAVLRTASQRVSVLPVTSPFSVRRGRGQN